MKESHYDSSECQIEIKTAVEAPIDRATRRSQTYVIAHRVDDSAHNESQADEQATFGHSGRHSVRVVKADLGDASEQDPHTNDQRNFDIVPVQLHDRNQLLFAVHFEALVKRYCTVQYAI